VIPAGERLRVLFATAGAHGHLFPVLPLALAARAAGHEVAVATDESFHPLLAAAGLRPVQAGMTVGTAIGLGIAVPDQNRAFLGACFLDICPPSLQLPGFADGTARVPLRPVGWNPPAPRPALARRDRERSRPRRPLIYLTFGTTFARPELLRQAIDGLARLPADVLAVTGPATAAAGLGDVPPNVSVIDWVPQADLLPEVDLVVSHGGSGTVLAALAAGRPQLVLPQGADQFSNARAVAGAGAGRMIMPAALSADRIAADARALLDDAGVRARAGELAGEIAALPAPAQVARDLGRLATARLAH
jgi:UDP:flavonoid glycosyltransferase YjiC (YdhE family)